MIGNYWGCLVVKQAYHDHMLYSMEQQTKEDLKPFHQLLLDLHHTNKSTGAKPEIFAFHLVR
jgi:hypothetical protein